MGAVVRFIGGFGRLYLSIRKNSCIVSFKATLDELLNTGAVDLVLVGIQVKHKVICEGLVFSQENLGLSGSHGGADVTSLDLFLCHLWPDPDQKQNKNVT